MMGDGLKEAIKKIELQSVLVLFFTLSFGTYLLSWDTHAEAVAGKLGALCIGCGMLYTILSFISLSIRESYKDVIGEYKNTLDSLRTSQRHISEAYQETIATATGSQSTLPQYKQYRSMVKDTTKE